MKSKLKFPDGVTITTTISRATEEVLAPEGVELIVALHRNFNQRRKEILQRRAVINALNSGAKVFMADFEDANTPTWENLMAGQINLRDAIRRTIEFKSLEGKKYRLKNQVAVLFVRNYHRSVRRVLDFTELRTA
jgi:malate synthase